MRNILNVIFHKPMEIFLTGFKMFTEYHIWKIINTIQEKLLDFYFIYNKKNTLWRWRCRHRYDIHIRQLATEPKPVGRKADIHTLVCLCHRLKDKRTVVYVSGHSFSCPDLRTVKI